VAYKSKHPNLDRSFRADRTVLNSFISHLRNKGLEPDEEKIEKYRAYITDYLLTYRISQVTWDDNTAYQIVARSDRQLNKALEILGGAKSQNEIFEKIMKEGRD